MALLEGGGETELLQTGVTGTIGGEAVELQDEVSSGRFSKRERRSTAMLKLSRRPSCSGEAEIKNEDYFFVFK